MVVGFGPIGRVVRAQGADTDEVGERAWHEVRRGLCEALMVRAASGHPGIEPGCTITLNETISRIGHWQVASARHLVSQGAYDNDATLLRADFAWHPPEAEPRGTVIMSAMVDHSDESLYHEPVPRDRLGRINVRFSFLPPPDMQAAYDLAKADTDRDGRITLDDYDEEKTDDYTANAEEWEKKAQAWENGDYDDPYPGVADEDLTEEQLAERREHTEKREEAIAYIFYKRLKRRDVARAASEAGALDSTTKGSGTDDVDDDNPTAEATGDESASGTQDGQAVDDETGSQERAPTGNVETEAAQGTGSIDSGADQSEEGTLPAPDPRRLPNPDAEADTEESSAPAEARWPPRIALPVVEPMAGAMHSFVGGHRQGDICRVAVHDPFTAEIVGYQYRDNRAINRDVLGAAAAIVVEHNFYDAWSGIVVRRIEDMVDPPAAEATDVAAEEAGAEEDESSDAAPEAPATQTTDLQSENGTGESKTGETTGDDTAGGNQDDTGDGTQDGSTGGGR